MLFIFNGMSEFLHSQYIWTKTKSSVQMFNNKQYT